MDGPCLTCGTAEGPFQKNHIGTRALWPDIWLWFCVPCHDAFTSLQVSLGVVRAGRKGNLWVPPRGEAGRAWALIEGAIVTVLMAVNGCEICRDMWGEGFTRVGQALGIGLEMLADAAGERPIRTDPVGADGRRGPRLPEGLHERGLLVMIARVGAALDPELGEFWGRVEDSAGHEAVVGKADSWKAEFGPEIADVLDGFLGADTLGDAWNVLLSHKDLELQMKARIEAALPKGA